MRQERVILDAAGVDRLSALVCDALTQAQVARADTIRLRLATEEILNLWRQDAPEAPLCTFECGTRFGRMYIKILAPGRRIDPQEAATQECSSLLYANLLARAGLSPVYRYSDGVNALAFYPPARKKGSPVLRLALTMAAALLVGAVVMALPAAAQAAARDILNPLFSAMMGILQTLAAPMIFLSVCWGIVNIGDLQTLGKIGRKIVLRFLGMVFLIGGLVAACMVWFFHPGGESALQGGEAIRQIYAMLLSVIPSDPISPFAQGNSLQIIFLAVCVGLALLLIGEKASAVRAAVEQLNTLVQFMMEFVSRYVCVFVFVSIVSLFLTEEMADLGGVMKGMLLAILCCVLCPLLYALAVSIKLKTPFRTLLRKLLPTYLIALSTASSSAVLSTSLETCRRKLGISERIVSFAVPLGQVVFKVGAAIGFVVLALGLAEFYNVNISLPWAITSALTAALLAIAAPPVPGGSLTCYTVLLTQLGIPQSAIGLAIAGNVILDFFMTSCGVSCLQSELTLAANRLGMLNRDRLMKEKV